jgi:serine/threonine protein kinase
MVICHSSLECTDVVRCYGYSSDPKRMMILMEYHPRTLFAALRTNTLTWPQKRQIAVDIARAMVYLHSQSPPLLHRGIKSINVLVRTCFDCNHPNEFWNDDLVDIVGCP